MGPTLYTEGEGGWRGCEGAQPLWVMLEVRSTPCHPPQTDGVQSTLGLNGVCVWGGGCNVIGSLGSPSALSALPTEVHPIPRAPNDRCGLATKSQDSA